MKTDIAIARGLKPLIKPRGIKVYCRVSSAEQKNGLANHEAMEKFCLGRGYAVDEWISANAKNYKPIFWNID